MRYAIVNGESSEPEPGLSGECRGCGQPMVARCGSVRIKHWAHKGKLICDPWSKDKTEWHVTWQDQFPRPWQEYRFVAESGEMHIADVKTDQEYVLEFQHSPIRIEERQSREAFYKNLVWVVDATKRKRDKQQFEKALKRGTLVTERAPVLRLRVLSTDCALIRDWIGSTVPVLFDFGTDIGLWYLLSSSTDESVYVTPVKHADFIKLHRGGEQEAKILEFWYKELGHLVSHYDSNLRRQLSNQPTLDPLRIQSQQPQRFQRQVVRLNQSRKRF